MVGRMLPVAHARRSFGVVPFGHLADPIRRVASALRHRLGGLPAREEPQNLPPTALMGLFGRPIAPLQLVDTEVGSQMITVLGPEGPCL